ncbi:DUF5675 family protein [Flavobacterium sp. PLA-1-15]|uniref:DUF5675 family protein n=1 Tax=Flavobacterium sp. PLA-1-15 TaxID=3380533 RepID=UPI003B7F2614
MVLFLTRSYFSNGTNGTLYHQGRIICHSIELPWKQNQRGVSCIPEGKYLLAKRYSRRHGWHILLMGTGTRQLILFHPANHANKELRGCIAPVTKLSGAGIGMESVKAFEKLKRLVYTALSAGEEVSVYIHS